MFKLSLKDQNLHSNGYIIQIIDKFLKFHFIMTNILLISDQVGIYIIINILVIQLTQCGHSTIYPVTGWFVRRQFNGEYVVSRVTCSG